MRSQDARQPSSFSKNFFLQRSEPELTLPEYLTNPHGLETRDRVSFDQQLFYPVTNYTPSP